jgi:hypothetical protein
MSALSYAQNIVTDTKEYTPEELVKIEEMQKKSPIQSTVKGLRLLWMDDTKVSGASFYMECLWAWNGKTTSGTTEEPHHHDFDEVIGFISTDPDHPHDLDARMEIILGDETHFLTKSCLVYIPAGMKHCPLTLREINRPLFWFTLAPINKYGRTNLTGNNQSTLPQLSHFIPPPPDTTGSRYARYIITEPKSHGEEKPPKEPTGKGSRIVSLDNEVIPGAFYVDFAWIYSGDMTMAPEAHTHDFDEMIGLVGLWNEKNPRKIDGDVNITIANEKYPIKQSSLIFVPKGTTHCPILFSNVKTPVLCFTIGNTPKWSKK